MSEEQELAKDEQSLALESVEEYDAELNGWKEVRRVNLSPVLSIEQWRLAHNGTFDSWTDAEVLAYSEAMSKRWEETAEHLNEQLEASQSTPDALRAQLSAAQQERDESLATYDRTVTEHHEWDKKRAVEMQELRQQLQQMREALEGLQRVVCDELCERQPEHREECDAARALLAKGE